MSTKPAAVRRFLGPLLIASTLIGCRTSAGHDEQLVNQFKEMHSRLYGVYSLGIDRDAIHDLLAQSFAGEALTREYVEHFTTLVQMEKEQTAIDVVRVDYEDVEVVGRTADAALVEADWSVGGVVTHQGHRHARVNRYLALYSLATFDGRPSSLRIVDTRVRNLQRVRSFQESTGFPLDDLPSSARGFMGPAELLRAGLLDEEASETSPPDDEDDDG